MHGFLAKWCIDSPHESWFWRSVPRICPSALTKLGANAAPSASATSWRIPQPRSDSVSQIVALFKGRGRGTSSYLDQSCAQDMVAKKADHSVLRLLQISQQHIESQLERVKHERELPGRKKRGRQKCCQGLERIRNLLFLLGLFCLVQ